MNRATRTGVARHHVVIAVLCYLGNPLLLIFWFWSTLSLESGLPGDTSVVSVVAPNVIRLNGPLYISITAPIYALFVFVHVVAGRVSLKFDSRTYFESAFRPLSVVLSMPGVFVLWTICLEGIELNVLGIVVAPILVVVSVLTFFNWCASLQRAYGSRVGEI